MGYRFWSSWSRPIRVTVVSGVFIVAAAFVSLLRCGEGANVSQSISASPGAIQAARDVYVLSLLTGEEFRAWCEELLGPGCKRTSDKFSPQRLDSEYRLGYVLFATNGKLLRLHQPDPQRVEIDATKARARLTADRVYIHLPRIVLPGAAPFLVENNVHDAPRKEGYRTPVLQFPDVEAWTEILANSEDGVAWVVGFRRPQ